MAGIQDATGVQFASGQDFFDHILTDWYEPIIVDTRNNSAVLWMLLPNAGRRNIAGKFVTYPARTTRNNQGFNAVHPGGKFPDPGSQGADTHTFRYRHMLARVLIDEDTMDAANTNGGSYADVLQFEIEGLMDDIVIQQNRMVHNDGSGRLAEVVSTTGTDVTLRINQDIEGAATCTTKPTLFIEEGMRLAFMTNLGASIAVKYVTAIVSDSVIQVADTPTGANDTTGIAAADWVCLISGEYTSATDFIQSGFRAEPMGIAGIYSDAGVLDGNGLASGQTGSNDLTTTSTASAGFQGIAANASNAFNQGIILDNGGVARPITESLMQQALSDAEETNNANIDLMLSSFSTYNSYVALLTPDKRYNDTLDLKGGHQVLSFNGIGWVKDRHAYGNRVYFMAMDQFKIYENRPLSWVDFHGRRWDILPDDDKFQARMKTQYTVACDVRNKTGALLVDLNA